MTICTHKFFFLLTSFFTLAIFIYFSASVILVPDIFQAFSFKGYSNKFCQETEMNLVSFIDQQVCKNKYKKNKFLWIFLDGLAVDQLPKLSSREKSHIPNFFKIKTNQYRQSGSLHETYLTGKFSRNFPAAEIKIDHIFNQARKANFDMLYRGTNFPLFFLLGQDHSPVFKEYHLYHNEPFPLKNLCEISSPFLSLNVYPQSFPSLIDENENIKVSVEEYYKFLDEKFLPSQEINLDVLNRCLELSGMQDPESSKLSNSVIFYTMIADHLNHSLNKRSSFTLQHTYSLEIDILKIMEWIKIHDEYALIVSSDHGGQLFNGEDDVCNHGCMVPGNEAVLTIFTKELFDRELNLSRTHQEFGDIEDVAPTVSQILENVNIPLETRGFPLFFNDDHFYNLIAMRSKEIQLCEFIKTYLNNFKVEKSLVSVLDQITESKFHKIIMDIKSEQDIEKIENIKNFIEEYKNFLKEKQNIINSITKDLGKSFMSRVILILVFILIIVKFYCTFSSLLRKMGKDLINPKLKICVFLVLICLFIDLGISFFYPNNLAEQFHNSHIYFFLIICAVIAVLKYLIQIYSDDQEIMTRLVRDIRYFLIGTFIAFILVYSTDTINLFHNLKFYFNTYEKGKALDYFNYPIFILLTFLEIKKFREFYVMRIRYLKIRLDLFLYFFNLVIISMVIVFDYSIPKHFSNQTYNMQILARTIYSFLLFYVIFSFKSFYKKNGNGRIFNSGMIFRLVKYPLILYVFFISDEAERLYMLFLTVPLFYFFSYYYKQFENVILKLLSAICLILVPDIIYSLNKGSFSFDISLKVTSKCIGDYPDQTPIFTGFLMGTHKLRLFILAAGFILDNINSTTTFKNNLPVDVNNLDTKKILDRNSYSLRLLLEMQLNLLMMSYFYYLYQDYEELYLTIFIWAGTKCLTILLVDLALIMNFSCCRSEEPGEVRQVSDRESNIESLDDDNKIFYVGDSDK
jgi:hypothetical protein